LCIGCWTTGVAALRVPLCDLVSNWAYMAIAALAWNIKAWFAMMMHRRTDRHDYIRMEFRRFFHAVILIPAMILRRARGASPSAWSATPQPSTGSSAPGPPSNASASADHTPARVTNPPPHTLGGNPARVNT
jgi:hypothetical protein